MVRVRDIYPNIYSYLLESNTYSSIIQDLEKVDWMMWANFNMKNRLLFENYWYFKDIVFNPYFIYLYTMYDRYFDLSLFHYDPFISFSSGIILFFMLNGRIPVDALLLLFGFLFNINPIYVVSLFLIWKYTRLKKHKPKQFRWHTELNQDCNTYSPEPLKSEDDNKVFDHILIGQDISTLYTAALLSKVGHKCCVLLSKDSTPEMVRIDILTRSSLVMPNRSHLQRHHSLHLHATCRLA